MKTYIDAPDGFVVGIHFPDPGTRQVEYDTLLSFIGAYEMEYQDVNPVLAQNDYLYIVFLIGHGRRLYWRDIKLDYPALSFSEFESIHYTELAEGSYQWCKNFTTGPRKLIASVERKIASIRYNHNKQFIVPVGLLIEEGWTPRYKASEYQKILRTFTKNT